MLLTAQDSRTAFAVAGTATILSSSVDPLRLSHAGRWECTVVCTHASRGISTIRWRTRGQSSWPWSAWVTTTLTCDAAGGTSPTATIAVDGGCALDLDVELTGSGGTSTASLYVVGV